LGNELTGWLSEVLEQWSAIRRQFPFGNDFFDSTNHYGLQIGPGHVGHWQKMLCEPAASQLDDARSHFGRAFVMKFEPDIEHLKPWYFAEKNSGQGLEQCLKIADLICQGKKYDDETKQMFLSRKASLLFGRGRENIYFDPSRGLNDLETAMILHLSSYEKAYDSGNSRLDKIEEYTRNSAYVIFQFLASNQRLDDLVETILRICEGTSGKLDPLEDPLHELSTRFCTSTSEVGLAEIGRTFEYMGKRLANPSKWYDRFACGRLQDHIKVTAANLNAAIRRLRRGKLIDDRTLLYESVLILAGRRMPSLQPPRANRLT